jgi:hypothetical protein
LKKEKKVALYEELFEQLGAKEFVAAPDKAKIVRERLQRAAEEFDRHHANVFAINMCLHAASSIILSKSEKLQGAIDVVQSKKYQYLPDKDPTTVLTVSVLYYLVNNDWDGDEAASAEYKDQFQKLRSGFDAINWLIGENAMGDLGFSVPAPKKQVA